MRTLKLFAVSLLLGICAAAQTPLTPEKLWSLHRISDPQVSPDGRTVVFTAMSPELEKNARPVQIWAVGLEGGSPRQITRDGSRNTRPRWSPDGKRIAFLSNRDGAQQIWLMDPDGGNARKVTDVPTEADGVMWSPDGSRLLFTSSVFPECRDMACNKKRLDEQAKGPSTAKVFEGLLYRHWTSFQDNRRSHLLVAPVAGGTPVDLTPGNYDAPPFSLGGPDDYAFSPDGREVAYTTNRDRVEAVSTNKDVFLVPVGGGEAKKITTNNAWDSTPVYSPDGRFLAYLKMDRAGYEADRLQIMLYDRKAGTHRNLTPKYDRSVGSMIWSPDSRRIYFVTEERSTHPIMVIDAAGGEPRAVVTGQSNDEISITRDGRTLVFTRASLQRPAEVYRAAADGTATAQPQPLTRMNDPLLAGIHISVPEPISFPGSGGVTINGFILKPPAFDANRKYPVMFLLHGGPQTAWNDAWSFRWNAQTFAGAGYVIVMVNRRGSTGFGQKFTDDINADWGGRAYDDIMRGVAYVEKLPYVDPQRIGASGASYGGYMVDWIAGHTTRFKCLVSHAGVYDLRSMYGATEELWFPEWEFGGAPWEKPEVYERWSPSAYVKNFKTPTLVTHGQLDFRVDISQGYQMFTALQKMNVPSKMVYFPDEGHWILKPANSVRWYKEVMNWWDQWLK